MGKLAEGEKLAKATKTKIGVTVGVVAASVAILAAVLLLGEESYRTIAVEEVNGTTLVASNGNEAVSAYEGMHLYSGDDVSVQKDSDMTMVLDMDKYVYAEPDTHFWLESDGTADDSRTVIYMEEGSVLNRITDTLNEGEVYQVDTPNSTMAVRGTVFRVTVYRGEDGLIYTLLEVFEGQVQVDLKTEDGEYNGVTEVFGPGEAALIRGNSDFSEFVRDGEIEWIETKTDTMKLPIAYKEIPQNTAKVLVRFIDDGEELCIGKELLMDYTKLAEHRMITREGKTSTCTEAGYEEVWCEVCNEVTQTIELPLLEHEPGEWEVTLEPTCEATGSRQKVCTVCGTVCEEEELEELGHKEGELQTLTAATCTGIGEQVAYCEICKKELKRVVINAPGHTAGNAVTVKYASCTEDGAIQTKCSVCSTVLSEGSIAKTGHSWGSWETISIGNCTSQGKERRTCSSCGGTEEQSTGAAGHVADETETVKYASCTEDGATQTKCSVCGTVLNKGSIAKTGHNWGSWEEIKPVTCTDDGMQERYCLVCGHTETEPIETTGHAWMGNDYRSEAEICTEEGEIQDYCSKCSPNALIFKESIPATGHMNIQWRPQDVIPEEAACRIGGTITGHCQKCEEPVEREISAGEHVYAGWHGDIMNEEGGMKTTCVCILCYEETVEADVVEDICQQCKYPAVN